MKAPPLLLDTHAWVWFLTGSDMLPSPLRAHLEEARREKRLFISAITPWEVAVLARKGRIVFSMDPMDWLDAALRIPGIQVVPLDAWVAIKAAYLDLPHPDPADRFILATALKLAAVLITRDGRLRSYGGVRTLWD
ncbi:type II toxin-antitoxin system VapC family toxin [Thermus amyloliquefaciens]|uniref:type II toxin-antitoxin system VapC family toxin n=1 Tax=Thermus amyloliquefaciens TaxID=1449080 RepID=UPI0005703C1F|nr:type II toxin-antitoxin system VapC family toxin [Thermus amyloliquefaciens]